MILQGDCFELIKTQPDNSVDLVITSPPYADIVSYGKNVSVKNSKEYVDWLLPLFDEIYRVLKPSGSFILNINDHCTDGLRNTYIYELIYRSQNETKLKFYDTYIWHKLNGIPSGSSKRFRNMTEFIFHFVKNQKEIKFHMNRVLELPAKATSERAKYRNAYNQGEVIDGERVKTRAADYTNVIKNGVRPDNVFRFHTAGRERDNTIKHPAPFNRTLPEYFIKFLTDKGDVVLDVFAGIGTTGLPCKDMERIFIGYELNEKYCEFGNKRIQGEELELWEVCQYDTEGNLIGCYKNRMEASKASGVPEIDIMRTYNRNKYETRGGYYWKLKKNETTIHQYDMEDNYIASFKGITAAAKSIGYSTPHNIMMCYRGFRNEAGGYKWKLE